MNSWLKFCFLREFNTLKFCWSQQQIYSWIYDHDVTIYKIFHHTSVVSITFNVTPCNGMLEFGTLWAFASTYYWEHLTLIFRFKYCFLSVELGVASLGYYHFGSLYSSLGMAWGLYYSRSIIDKNPSMLIPMLANQDFTPMLGYRCQIGIIPNKREICFARAASQCKWLYSYISTFAKCTDLLIPLLAIQTYWCYCYMHRLSDAITKCTDLLMLLDPIAKCRR